MEDKSQPLVKKSPLVSRGLDKESDKSDFNREDNNSVTLGCYGKIWRVSHKKTARLYGIKVLHKHVIKEKSLSESIDRTLANMYKLEQPHLLKVVNHFEDEDNIYLILQNVNYYKGTVLDRVKEMKEEDILSHFKTVVNTVNYLHSKGVYNRDLNPQTIFFDDYEYIKISDCGWSDISEPRNKQVSVTSSINSMNGSKQTNSLSNELTNSSSSRRILYTPPEVLRGEASSKQSDVWNLGCLLFEMITRGETPFKGQGEALKSNILNLKMQSATGMTNETKGLIEGMLRLNPNDRLTIADILSSNLLQSVKIPNSKFDAEEGIINRTISYISPQEQLITKLKKEIEILKKENENIKKSYNDLQSEHQTAKSKLSSLQMDISTCEGGEEDSFAYLEGKMKFDYVNKDRISKCSELEEKSNEILNYRSTVRLLENELEINNLNLDEIKEQNRDFQNEINKLTSLLESERQEKESKIELLNNKLEMLQNKLFNPRESVFNASEESVKNISLVILELVKEFNEALQKVLRRSKDEHESLMKNLRETMTSKENSVKECYYKTKEGIETELLRLSAKNFSKDKGTSNEKMNWLSQQVKELLPFKQKSLTLEENLRRSEKEIKILGEKLNLLEIERNTLKSLCTEKGDSLDKLTKYATNIENKLSDIKAYITHNFTDMDKIEELFLTYKI